MASPEGHRRVTPSSHPHASDPRINENWIAPLEHLQRWAQQTEESRLPTALSLRQLLRKKIILARIMYDERPLRRVIKKLHAYTAVPQAADTREALLLELASFELVLRKNSMTCEAETRQVAEYQREKRRIDDDHSALRTQIEELKVALDHAQLLRRRKIEYDAVAEKVNTLPTRDELARSIALLENDIAAIRAEHETQNNAMHSHKAALDSIISELGALRFMKEADGDREGGDGIDRELSNDRDTSTPMRGMPGEEPASMQEEAETTETVGGGDAEGGSTTENNVPVKPGGAADDIEMGELAEEPQDKSRGRKAREDLEEGEATDASSSELSDPPTE